MAPEPDTYCCSYRVGYETDADAPLASDVLAHIRFGAPSAASADPRQISIPLSQIGAVPMAEVWHSRLPVVSAWADGFGYAHNGEVLFGHLSLKAADSADLDRVTTEVYARIDRLRCGLGYPHGLRIWNFVGEINRGEGDAERYRQFSLGRHHALALKSDFESQLPAATAIGTPDGGLTVYFLAARDPGEQVENPRQVSAFRYPASYGPQSPSFSRATLKHWADRIHLFVSGTASVVGHKSLHAGDALAQLEETHRNIDALFRQAAALRPGAGPFSAVSLKIYLRHAQDWPLLKARVAQLFGPEVPLLVLAGDICRRELLIEIEGLFTATPLPPDQALDRAHPFHQRLDYYARVAGHGLCLFSVGLACILVSAVVFPLIRLSSPDPDTTRRRVRLCLHYWYRFFRAMGRILGVISYEFHGEGRLSAPGQLIVANHPSLIDMLFIGTCVPQVNCIVKDALLRHPFLRRIVRWAGYIPNSAPEHLIENCATSLRAGNTLLVFPEGTRSAPGEALKLKRGAAHIAIAAGVDLLPVTIVCQPSAMTKNDVWYRAPAQRPHWRISVGEPIRLAHWVVPGEPASRSARRLTAHLTEYFTVHIGATAQRAPAATRTSRIPAPSISG